MPPSLPADGSTPPRPLAAADAPVLPRSPDHALATALAAHALHRRSRTVGKQPRKLRASLAAHSPRSGDQPAHQPRRRPRRTPDSAAGLPAAATRTVVITPSAVRQFTSVTSAASRISIRISATPLPTVQSIVDDGSATQNGTSLSRRQRLQVSADLVRHVAGARHPVGADDRQIHLAVLHQVPAGVVRHHGVLHAVRAEFPRAVSAAPWLRRRVSSAQTCTFYAAVMRRSENRCQRGAPVHRRQPAGVAMRQRSPSARPGVRAAGLDQRRAVPPGRLSPPPHPHR